MFSLLLAAFSDQQDSALADYLQASVMLQYNMRWCWLLWLLLATFIQANIAAERTQNCQNKLIYFVAR